MKPDRVPSPTSQTSRFLSSFRTAVTALVVLSILSPTAHSKTVDSARLEQKIKVLRRHFDEYTKEDQDTVQKVEWQLVFLTCTDGHTSMALIEVV